MAPAYPQRRVLAATDGYKTESTPEIRDDMNVAKMNVRLNQAGMLHAQLALEDFLFVNGARGDIELKAVLILKEIFGNAHRHGTGEKVACRFRWLPSGAEMRYCYATAPFDPAPGLPEDVFEETGRGLLLIHELADYVNFHLAHRHAQVVTMLRPC